jgi:hypothetical protein
VFNRFSFKATPKLALPFILGISIITVIDSNIIKFFTYTYEELTVLSNVELFTISSVLIAIIAFILLRGIEIQYLQSNYGSKLFQDVARIIIQVVQFTVIGFLAFVILEMFFFNMYHLFLIDLIVLTSFITSILFLISLVVLLAGWFKTRKNYMIIAYAISFSIISAYLALSIIYVNLQFSYQSEWIKAAPIHLALVNFPASDLGLSYGTTLDAFTLLSYILVWTATFALLRQYRNKFGKIKFYVLIGIPLVYFLFPFETYITSFSEGILSDSPITFSVIYFILFSATKQVGGVLFSIVFLTAGAIINQQNLRNSLTITAIGIVVLFGSSEIGSLLYAAYPPYGVLTVLLMPLGSYFLFTGLYTSARFVSRDKVIRKEFFQSAEKQLAFLKTIGTVQMEKELEKNLRSILRRSFMQEENLSYNRNDDEDVRGLVREVLHELQSKETKDEHPDSN